MAFKYNPPTRTFCSVCEKLSESIKDPIIDTFNGKASSAKNFIIHNWYNFVLGYSPQFPDYLIDKFNIKDGDLLVDPFMGTGTTLVSSQIKGIRSAGVDANDYFIDVAKAKLNWGQDVHAIKKVYSNLLGKILDEIDQIDFKIIVDSGHQFTIQHNGVKKYNYEDLAKEYRIPILDSRYISDRPLVKWKTIKNVVEKSCPKKYKNFFMLGVSSIIVPSSNIKYGPGFGVVKAKIDIDVVKLFKDKIHRMIDDLEKVSHLETKSEVFHGDARLLDSIFKPNSVSYLITSPPYPGDHEYTKHTKLELILMDHAHSLEEFRVIKKRMLRGSTTNIYKGDNEKEYIADLQSIKEVTELIQERLTNDGATSGFEKLYTKLVWEYFGGMYRVFASALPILKHGGKFSLLVSDSHAFKMVHIRTAHILAEVALKAGFQNSEIELWQNKLSTSHKYMLHENILTVTK